jgi:hypothetical protein
MALELVLDFALGRIDEPGYHEWVSTRRLADAGNPKDTASNRGIWRDEPTKTLMLRPMQLDPSWLNTQNQLDSIISLKDLAVNAADTAAQAIFEQAAFGNPDNPFIYHVPVGPAASFPGSAVNPMPGTAPSLVGITPAASATSTDSLVRVPALVYQPSTSLVDFNVALPTPTQIGDTTTGKFVAESKARLDPNQGLYLRWAHPQSQLGFPCTYSFDVGQFRLLIKDVVIEVFRDTSSGGNRTAFKKILTAPMWSVGDFVPQGVGNVMSFTTPQAEMAHDRSLLWLPYRRHQVLLYANTGKWAVITVKPFATRLADDSDWDIVRSDTILVWVQTPAPGRFQIQKLKYPAGSIVLQTPPVTLDYTPASPPTVTLSKDSDHGSALTSVRSQPPSYALPVNDASDCPTSTTDPTSQTQQHGIELTFTASSDKRRTPFFYGYTVTSPRTFAVAATTPESLLDSGTGSKVMTATLTAGQKPGDGRLTAETLDVTPFPTASHYYRHAFAVQLKDGATSLFVGITEPNEVVVLKEPTTTPRRVVISALDRWKQLGYTYLRDQRDWQGYGHIDVVKFICEQGGVDCTAAEFPAGYVPGVLSTTNSALGGTEQTVAQQTQELQPGWKPRDDDTAAIYIERVAKIYSGWDVGFRLDGTFYYLPKAYFTTPTVTFASSHAGAAPWFYNVNFTTDEPEANVILVKAADAVTGSPRYSSLWVDWASLRNPAAVNYLGRWKAEVVIVGGVFTCAQLNWMARTIWTQTRRRFVRANFEADFVPGLKIGGVCTLGTYGNYRVSNFQVDIAKASHHRAQYEAVLVEAGF